MSGSRLPSFLPFFLSFTMNSLPLSYLCFHSHVTSAFPEFFVLPGKCCSSSSRLQRPPLPSQLPSSFHESYSTLTGQPHFLPHMISQYITQQKSHCMRRPPQKDSFSRPIHTAHSHITKCLACSYTPSKICIAFSLSCFHTVYFTRCPSCLYGAS